jgi:hypothetical protein
MGLHTNSFAQAEIIKVSAWNTVACTPNKRDNFSLVSPQM